MTGPVDPGAGEGGAPVPPPAGEGPADGPPPGAGEAPPVTPTGSKSNTGLIVGIILAILVVLGGGGALIASLH
jgi:hypothetical protein